MTAKMLTLVEFHPKLMRFGKLRCFTTLPNCNAPVDKKEEVLKKLIYSSKSFEDARWHKILEMRKFAKEKAKNRAKDNYVQSIALKYLSTTNIDSSSAENNVQNEEIDSPLVMPMGLKVVSADHFSDSDDSENQLEVSDDIPSVRDRDSSTVSLRKVWSNDYMQITHKVDNDDEHKDDEWVLKYGSSNAAIPSSRVPCGGCGALLHCKDSSIPGFIPQEIFTNCKTRELRTITCQRCYFLKIHNTALSISVDSRVYPKIIAYIKKRKALVLLAVDLTDFPCSIWPNISELVGLDCPMYIVGNKVDLLDGDSEGWMIHVQRCLRSCFPVKANILGTTLISAKTGFGIEELISKLQNIWRYQGDVYLIGCTNVGKSTIFNALLQSDYCKVKAVDLVQKATTAPWPGTTLNLLKFPILRPEGWRIYLRSQRLKNERIKNMEAQLKKEQSRNRSSKPAVPQLIGHIGRTFHQRPDDEDDPFSATDFDNKTTPLPGSGLNPNDPDFVKGHWFFDTPGVLHDDQILDLLTTDELMKVLPQKMIEPRNFIMKPGWTLFVGGLARVDYLKGDRPSTKWTLFVSRSLPITICSIDDAEEVYDTLLGSETFQVPSGDAQRLKKWPALKYKDVYKFSGIGKSKCCGDIVLSSCGWLSFAPDLKEVISVRPWTPEGRGIYTRSPALLPFAVKKRGVLMKGTPAFSRPPKQQDKLLQH